MDAFNLIAAELAARFRGRVAELTNAVRLATNGKGDRFASVEREGGRLFAEMRGRVFQRLEIHRFSFTRPTRGDLAARGIRSALSPDMPAVQSKNTGGKPIAKHWDAMWADIAFRLWNGDLKPAKQADISKVMHDSLLGQGVIAGDTAVTERARAPWQRIEAERLG